MAGKGKIVRGALGALTDVFKKSDDAPVDESRRTFVKGAAVAPIVAGGALAGIKAGTKLIDDVPTPVKKEAVQEAGKILENISISDYDWINELFSISPKLRQMVGKDIQKSFVDEWTDDEILDASINHPHWLGKSPADYEKIFLDHNLERYGPATDFGLMDSSYDFHRDLNKFLIGDKPNPDGIFSELSKAYKKQWKSEFPKDDVNSKLFEAGQREFFMKQLFSEQIQDSVFEELQGNKLVREKLFDLDKIFKKIEQDNKELGLYGE
tara:strand:- start:316 stop:1116 length:801 start_codon:yes stop_codon:yes gene_type:complete